LLSGQGFKEVYNLKGGIKSWQGHETSGPAEMGMVLLTGHETSEEVIILAYGLETGLKDFYTRIGETTDDPDVSELLGKLAKIEDNHRQRLFNLYASLVPGTVDQQSIETGAGSEILEGGFETDTFIEQNRPAMQTSVGVLDVAMMLETQAMDLYMRYAEKSSDDKVKQIFFDLANEEKAHLKRLGDLMNEKAAVD
jgi:rubrerythrin